jgi:hypothetical protein
MTFKKYSIKSHYKVNKLVRIIKISHFKNLSDNLNMNKTTKVFGKKFLLCHFFWTHFQSEYPNIYKGKNLEKRIF